MDARRRTEKSFRYVVRAPSGSGLDVMNVDVKVDTAWLFQDAEDAGGEPGDLVGVASGPGVEAGMLAEQLESPEQKLLAVVDKSGSCLQSRIQELELSEQRLLRKVDQLSARLTQERSAFLRAQRQLEALQGALASQVREQERTARRLQERLRLRDEALGRQAAALERGRRTQRRQLGLAREQERELRAQVRRLQRNVRRLCRAASRLLAELDGPARPPPQGPAADQEAARWPREERTTERCLRAQLEELRCCVYELKLSEIGLQGQVEDLLEQNQSLREELGAKGPEEGAGGTAPSGHCSPDTLGCVQNEFLPLPREETLDLCQGHNQQCPLWLDEAGEQGACAGLQAKGPCTWGCARAEQGLPVWGPGPETIGVLLGELTRSDCEQPQLALAVTPWDEQTLLLVCGCPSRQHVDGSLLPVGLPQPSEHSPMVTSARGPFPLVQMCSLPLQGPAEDLAALPLLLLPEASSEKTQIQEVPLLAPEATGHPDGDYHGAWGCGALHQESPQISNPQCPGKGPEARGAPGPVMGQWEVREALGDPGSQCPWHQQAPGTQAPALHPQPEPPRQGEFSGPEGSPNSPRRRGEVPGQVWGPAGVLWSEREEAVPPATLSGAHGMERPSPPGGWLRAEKGGAGGRGRKGREERPGWSGGADLLWQESPREEGLGDEEGASPGHRDALEELDTEGCDGRDTLCLAEEQGWRRPPGLPWPAEVGHAASRHRVPGTDSDWYACAIDAFEAEVGACLQQLSALQLGTQGARWEGSMPARRWSSHEDPADRGADVWSAKEAAPREMGEEAVPGRTGASRVQEAPPGTAPALDGTSPGRTQLSGPLERARTSCRRLIARLTEERRAVLLAYARLRAEPERGCRTVRALERERERVSALQQDNDRLSWDVSHLRTEVAQYLQLISDLEDCNGKSYRRISELDQDNEALRRQLGRARRAMAQSARRAEGALERAEQENSALWALVSELRVGYKGLIQDIMLGTEDVIQGLQGDKARLLHRVRALQQVAAPEGHPDSGPLDSCAKGSQEGAVDKAVQVGQLSGQRLASVQGPSSEEDMVQARGQEDLSSSQGSLGRGADSPALFSAWANTMASGVLREDTHQVGEEEAEVATEKRQRSSADQGRVLGDVEAEASKEDLRLRVGQLHHQVLTLTCQLRDQKSLHRELQASREEADHLREKLQSQHKDFQKRQHEANLAVTPLKAKVASLVRKCQERNGLITHLLQELQRRGPACPLLAEHARNMLEDAALAEYAATFLTTGVREVDPPAPCPRFL